MIIRQNLDSVSTNLERCALYVNNAIVELSTKSRVRNFLPKTKNHSFEFECYVSTHTNNACGRTTFIAC